ncbi:MAG: sigma-70 family RNA polymerase sigma factor [Selenomonadaceae bacterium]|nr:sigma-70 family RNA polymerase sigma factor [Selenomonadaceae bacterium]
MTEKINSIEAEDIEIYLEEVKRIPLLSAQEFHTLLIRSAQGDEDAQTELVNANLRLVVEVAKNYVGQGTAFSDLIQDGNVGLIKAVKKFSTKGSATFTEYAEECIEAAIVRSLRETDSDMQISLDTPVDERAYIARDKFAQEGDYVEGLTLADFVEDETPTHFERLSFSQLREILGEALESLSAHEKKILALRFGLEDGRTHSIDEVAKIFKVGNENIRQAETKALKKLRQHERTIKLREFY